MTKPTVSLCMIVRDEEKNLPHCLKGMAGLLTEIIVVDTGSSDATRTVAANLGAKVYDFPWIEDFSAARNESCRHATGDYIFWLDADDRLDEVNFKRLEDLIAGLATKDPLQNSVFMMSCISRLQGSKSSVGACHSRLFPNRTSFRWVGRVHERVEFGEGATAPHHLSTDVVIRHEGYEGTTGYAQKQYRNLRILEQEFVANPDDVWNLFYLGRVRNWQGNMPEALRFLQRSIRLDPLNRAAVTPFAFLLAADSLRKMHRTDEALRTLDEGLLRFPNLAPLIFTKACLLRQIRRFAQAEIVFRHLLSLPPHQFRHESVWFDLQRERWHVMLGHVLHEQGQYREAEAEYRLALNEDPDSSEAWFAMGQLTITLGKTQDTGLIARRLMTCPNGAFECAVLQAQICVLDRRFDDARHWVSRAIAIRPDDVCAHVVRSILLFREGIDWEQCREAHETVLRLDPHHVEARQRLEQVRAKLAQQASASDHDPGNGSGIHPASMPLSDLGAGCGLSFFC